MVASRGAIQKKKKMPAGKVDSEMKETVKGMEYRTTTRTDKVRKAIGICSIPLLN